MPLEDGMHPWIETKEYRDVAQEGQGITTYGNYKFQRVLAHALKTQRGNVTPADLAFIELVMVATLSGKSLAMFPEPEKAYRKFLVFAKAHLGRHHAVAPAGSKPRSLFIGTRCARMSRFESCVVFLSCKMLYADP